MFYNTFEKLQDSLENIEKYKEVYLVDIDTMLAAVNKDISSFPSTPNYFLMKVAGAYKGSKTIFTYIPSIDLYKIASYNFGDSSFLFICSALISTNYEFFEKRYFNSSAVIDNFFIGGTIDDYPNEKIKRAVPDHDIVSNYKTHWKDYPSNLIAFSVGCPLKCHFCYTRTRTFSHPDLIESPDDIKKFYVFEKKPLIILDESFGSLIQYDKLEAFLEYLKNNKIRFEFRNGFNLKALSTKKIELILRYRKYMNSLSFAWDILEQDRPLELLKTMSRKGMNGNSFIFIKTSGLSPMELKKSYLSGLYRGMWLTYYKCRPRYNPEIDFFDSVFFKGLLYKEPVELAFYNMFSGRVTGINKSTAIPLLCMQFNSHIFTQAKKVMELLEPKAEGDIDYRSILEMLIYEVSYDFLYELGKYIGADVEKHFSGIEKRDFVIPSSRNKTVYKMKINNHKVIINPYSCRTVEKKGIVIGDYLKAMEKSGKWIKAKDFLKGVEKTYVL